MQGLAELHLQTSYHKGRDDIAAGFYLPCMNRSTKYDRAVGYFRSTVFLIAWPELRGFVQRGGKIRVLCSQVLADKDVDALERGYSARVNAEIDSRLLEEVRNLLNDPVISDPARVLAALVAHGTVDLKVAILRDSEMRSVKGRIFHDKLGIFGDEYNNRVVFKGSMNETWTGLANDGNLESVDVAVSWMGARDVERVRTEESYFADLWHNRYPTLNVRPFPDVARHELENASEGDWPGSLTDVLDRMSAGRDKGEDARGRTLHSHQSAGLAAWRANGRRGILAFATGSGKTFTAITAIREAITKHGDVVVVVVPDRVLFQQWYRELEETTSDLDVSILRAGSGYRRWRDSLRLWTLPDGQRRIVLATVRTAASGEFRRKLSGGAHLMLVADEVHRLGSARNRELLDEELFGARLGLSATPERAGDPEGTQALLSYFGGILQPRYMLADAVRDGVLTKYFYRPHTVHLTELEAQEWQEITARIATLRARIANGDQSSNALAQRLDLLYIRRARVVKHASAKVPLAVCVLRQEGVEGQRWIVYCEDLTQLNQVSTALADAGIPSLPFHSQMEGSREETLQWLDRRGGIVVAIKCLDEGVDVPSVTHALILASSKNPREFVQRRGRVLRRADGKSLAFVHDAIVLPPAGGGREGASDPITAGELARAVEFAQHADNPAASADLQQIAIDLGIDRRTLLQDGFEDADD
ncbi:DEAD/DEAH box helicase family protein [Symbioplanes lichenis]|uniref:DEAD/DEAH box helicase family protein n=1 Tax=Symbioplanes lichenis TaxID=1629072 RepID=UPI002739938A|nr:DEAD/DEAH box helicase family protein [Actinoplanes lichenis]